MKNATLRFVVLFHQVPDSSDRRDHWDLMLESETGLITWALESMLEADVHTFGRRLANHRKEYLEYEGPVSQNRGSVMRLEEGTYELLSETAGASTYLLRKRHADWLQVEIEKGAEGQRCSVVFSAVLS